MSQKRSLKLAITFCALFSLTANAQPPLTADQILKEVEKRVSAVDESATLEMTIIEANSASKTRDVQIRRKTNGNSHKVMVKIQGPANLRGTALLSISEGTKEDQWLYLPSSKQTRRILSSNKSSNFLDSELSYEDMGSSSNRKYVNSLLRTEKTPTGDVAVIESKLSTGDSAYSRILAWVPLGNFLVTKLEYYDLTGKLLKVTEMGTYKKFAGGIWRTQDVQVKNVQNHRSTHLMLKDLKINQGLDDHVFTESEMAEE
jgi:outer membrane lipoprotein-sorting protein